MLPSLALGLLLLAAPAAEDVVTLVNGDRISGKVLSKSRRLVRLQTAHGTLQIRLDAIQKIRKADGTEEVLTAPPTPAPKPVPPTPVRLLVRVRGKAFWQAWDAASAPADPTLRLEVRADDTLLATYVDARVDEGEIPKAVVNTFAFTPESLVVVPAAGVRAPPPEAKPGQIVLVIELAPALAGARRLRLAYQSNVGSMASPEWSDLVATETTVALALGDNPLRLEQDRGRMEYSRKSMKNVNSFTVSLTLDTPTP
jgi:hypothetical protein